jgi:hypothetical protein
MPNFRGRLVFVVVVRRLLCLLCGWSTKGDEKIYKFVGDKDQQQAGIEASLDIQYIMGVAPHVKAEFWWVSG